MIRLMLTLHTARILAALLLVIAATASIQATTVPDLSGKWRLNSELSEDAKQKLEKVLQDFFIVGRHGGNVDTNQDPRDSERDRVRRRIEALIEASEMIEISQDKKEVTISEGNLRERKLYADGRSYQRQDRRGNLVTIKARWLNDLLVVETKLADGGKFSESYELAPVGRQLVLTVKSEDRRLKQPLVIRRVYDAVTEIR